MKTVHDIFITVAKEYNVIGTPDTLARWTQKQIAAQNKVVLFRCNTLLNQNTTARREVKL